MSDVPPRRPNPSDPRPPVKPIVPPVAAVPTTGPAPAVPVPAKAVPVAPRPVPVAPKPGIAPRAARARPPARTRDGSDPGATSAAVPATAAKEPAPAGDAPVAPRRVVSRRAPAGPAAPPPPGEDPLIGTTVARCRIIERIGQGKTAVVYRAEHAALNLPVAVKILHPSILEFPELVAKFEAEARAIARLDHPNALKIYDVHSEGDVHAIVMELLDGESVLDLLQREGAVDPVDALRIVRQAAGGLEAAHSKGIIHRDVKPQNLVIMPDGTVKLVDFGLATAIDGTGDATSIRIGTPHYMAPEVCEARAVGPKSDVYSLGITLYHLLVGQPPFAGKTVKEILQHHIEAKPLEPERRRIGLAKPIAELVRAMTKRDELTRMSVADVIATVDRIGGEELKANVKLRVGRGRRRRGKRSGAPVIAIVIGALVLVGGLIAILAGGGSDAPDPRDAPRTNSPTATGPTLPATVEPAMTGDAPAVETEAQRAAREADLKKKEAEARLRQSRAELEDATNFARLQWEDKGAVVQRYRRVGRSFGDTEAGKDAKKRAELIEKGEMHPHPDRVYAPKTTVDRAREAWETLRGQVDEAISAFRYDEAVRLVPTAVEDPEGRLADDVEFHRQVALDLVAFRSALDGALDAMKPEARDIRLEKGVARVQRVRSASISVEQAGAATELVWSDALVDEICALAKRAFVSKDPRTSVQLATFAWAHRRRGVFFQTAIALKTAMAMSGTEDPHLAKLLARATTRMPK